MSAPERIYLPTGSIAFHHTRKDGEHTEYVRADLYARLQGRVETLRKEQDRCLAARDAAGVFPASPSETITILAEMSDTMLARAETAEAERDRLREAGAYYIDRLKAAWAGKPVRDMGEAESAWRAALQKEHQP
ncbi:MAG: hypothetical protein ACTHOP_22155 [Mesorhizobium sp.]